MGETARSPTGAGRALAAIGAGGVVAWLAGELLLRRGVVPVLAPVLGSGLGADMLLVGVGFPLLAVAIAAVGRRAGVSPADWEYDRSVRALIAGVAGAVGYFVALFGGVIAASLVVGTPDAPGPVVAPTVPLWALALLLVVNGVVVPVAEELAWRGVIQTALTRRLGVGLGVGLTAAAFVAKHLVVDMAAPPVRVFSLVTLAVVLGLLRQYYGTASSTVAHLLANLAATGLTVGTVLLA